MNIIITGTSRGIGLEVALHFASHGHQVLALSRKSNPKLLGNPNISFLAVDLTLEADVDKVVGFIQNTWKKVDVLINNAGALVNKAFEQITSEEFEYVYQVNVFGVARITRAVLPFMDSGAHVVSISSIGGVQGSMKFPGLAAYSSSKAAVIILSELLAEEYKEKGISFNVLALGAVQTEMLAEAFPGYNAPVGPIEMAKYIYNFALDGAKFHNGKTIEVSSSTP
ncbi:MAG TPA: SDR family oxidoreductase [Flavobacterium sp.]|nr:SDR family oxidoreductase [Flavobacterium sp.]